MEGSEAKEDGVSLPASEFTMETTEQEEKEREENKSKPVCTPEHKELVTAVVRQLTRDPAPQPGRNSQTQRQIRGKKYDDCYIS